VARRDLARLVHAGGMERIAHGIYRVSGAPRPRLLELRAAWLQLAPGVVIDQRTLTDGVVSHASAATVYEVGLLDPFRHEFVVPTPQRVRSRRDDVLIHLAPITSDEVWWFDELLVTVPTRMVADLCSTTIDGEHLAGVVVDILDKHRANADELATVLAPYAQRYGLPAGEGREFLDDLMRFAP
jgi:predicted transcriptional regulator of viral defense system